MNRDLIGKKEVDAFSWQHLLIPEDPIDDQTSTCHACVPPPQTRGVSIPSRTVIEHSGYTNAKIPTITHPAEMSEYTPDQLSPIEVQNMRRKNTTEYQNLTNHDPYKSIAQISYQWPSRTNTGERAATAVTIRRGAATGYNANSTTTAGAPGDPRTFKTGKTEAMKKFKDPQLGFKGRNAAQVPNVVEKSGYWTLYYILLNLKNLKIIIKLKVFFISPQT